MKNINTYIFLADLLKKEKKTLYLWIFNLILIPLIILSIIWIFIPNDYAIFIPIYVWSLTSIMLFYFIIKNPKLWIITLWVLFIMLILIFFLTDSPNNKIEKIKLINYFTNLTN